MNILSLQLEKITDNVFNKKGYYFTKIINNWQYIVGSELADYTLPKKIIFDNFSEFDIGRLYINVKSSSIATELEYSKLLIIERISLFFGYKIINQIKLVIDPSIFKNDSLLTIVKDDPIISPQKKEQLDYEISEINDDDLKKSLFELGSLILYNTKA